VLHSHRTKSFNHKSISVQTGFTLIEIMVVVIIIALMVALLTINLSRDLDRLARFESERFLVIVNEVRDEAIISGESFILFVNETSYVFEAAAQRSAQRNYDGLLKRRVIQEGVELDWDVFEDVEDDTQDHVLISPLGEITPFDARFIGDDIEFHVLVNDENQLEQRTENAK